jgi:hypothetical protein
MDSQHRALNMAEAVPFEQIAFDFAMLAPAHSETAQEVKSGKSIVSTLASSMTADMTLARPSGTVCEQPNQTRTQRIRAELDLATNITCKKLLGGLLAISTENGALPQSRNSINKKTLALMCGIQPPALSTPGPAMDILIKWAAEFPLSQNAMSFVGGCLEPTAFVRDQLRQLIEKKACEHAQDPTSSVGFYTEPHRPSSFSRYGLASELGLTRAQVQDPKLYVIMTEALPRLGKGRPWTGFRGLTGKALAERWAELDVHVQQIVKSRKPFPAMPGRPKSIDFDALEVGSPGETLKNNTEWQAYIRTLAAANTIALDGYKPITTITWSGLAAKGQTDCNEKASSPKAAQSRYNNLKSTLTRIRTSLEQTEHAEVGDALSGKSGCPVRRFLGVQDADCMSKAEMRNLRNQLSYLGFWRNTLGALQKADVLPDTIERCIEYLIRVEAQSYRHVSAATGISEADLSGWCNGGLPFNPRRTRDAVKIEEHFKLASGTLVALLSRGRRARQSGPAPSGFENADPRVWKHIVHGELHGEKLAEAITFVENTILSQTRNYTAKAKASKQAWAATASRTADLNNLPRQVIQQGREPGLRIATVLPEATLSGQADRLFREMNSLTSFRTAIDVGDLRRSGMWSDVTAEMQMTDYTGLFRWMAFGSELGGLDVSIADLSFVILLNPQVLITYVLWRCQRTSGFIYEGSAQGATATVREFQMLHSAANLVSLTSGWIAQHGHLFKDVSPIIEQLPRYPDIYTKSGNRLSANLPGSATCVLPESMAHLIKNGNIDDLCRKAENRYRSFAKSIQQILHRSRDSFEPILPILLADRPMDVYLGKLFEVRSTWADKVLQPSWYATDLRDQIICELGGLTCLRSKNLRQLTYKKGAGQLFFDGNDLIIKIPRENFKNGKSKSLFGPPESPRDYERAVPNVNNIHEMVREWTEDFLPNRQITNGGGWLFPGGNEGDSLTTSGLNEVFTRMTASHFVLNPFDPHSKGIEGVMRFGPHAVRDLGATHILKTQGGLVVAAGQAAMFLYTSQEMIEAHYARIEMRVEIARFDSMLLESGKNAARGRYF